MFLLEYNDIIALVVFTWFDGYGLNSYSSSAFNVRKGVVYWTLFMLMVTDGLAVSSLD